MNMKRSRFMGNYHSYSIQHRKVPMPGKLTELLHLNKSPNHSFTFYNSSVYLRNIVLYIICIDVHYIFFGTLLLKR